MKINKVEIQAFKSYLYKNDGTFDFTISSDTGEKEAADFISIYAPNGFGKTSFYDAIDFAITKNITRYIRNKKISKRHNDDAKKLNQDNSKQFILRNRDADTVSNDLDTEVKVFTTKDKEPFCSPDVSARCNNKDYHFDDGKTPPEMRYFRDVMLSQEMIDSFLREASPEDRYKKFSNNPTGELQQAEEKRKLLKRMCKDVTSEKGKLSEDKIQQNNKLKRIDETEAPFDASNQLIRKLPVSDFTIEQFTFPYTEANKSKSIDQITIAKNQLTQQNVIFKKNINRLQSLLVNLDQSKQQLQDHALCNERLKQASTAFNNTDQIIKIELKNGNLANDIAKNALNHKELQAQQGQISTFVSIFKSHNELTQKISYKIQNKEKLNTSIHDYETNLESLRHNRKDTEERLANAQNEKVGASVLFKYLWSLQDKNSQLTKDIEEIKAKQLYFGKQEIHLKQEKERLKNFTINTEIDAKLLNNQVLPLNQLHKKYIAEQSKKLLVQDWIRKQEVELQIVQSQSKSVNELISQASKIIIRTQQSDCPLCQHPYKDFEELRRQINANPALSHRERVLHKEIEKQGIQECQHVTELSNLQVDYSTLLQTLIAEKEIKINEIKYKQQHKEAEKESIESLISINNKKNIELVGKTQNKNEIEYSAYIQIQISSHQKMTLQLTDDIDKINQLSIKASTKLSALDQKLIILEGDHTHQTSKLKPFSVFINYLQLPYIPDTEEAHIRTNLLASIAKLESEKCQFERAINKNKQQIKELVSSIPNVMRTFTQEQLQQQKKEFETNITQLNQALQNFNSMLRVLKKSQPEAETQWLALRTEAGEEVNKLQLQVQNCQGADADLTLLIQLAEKAVNYCHRQDIEIKIKEIEACIKQHEIINTNLSSDLSKINTYIQEIADAYFKTELINQIYKAIDPHPEYKRIEFKCDIPNDGNPQLNIIAINEGNHKVSPNLNFSSAQINVLSLSIFLARALTTTDNDGKPVDCIFIDDPIQSMDSINVLSLIDLFRNISSRLGKQLIIATHDENFHELLKKKIPPNIFKAKYLHLASFGKVAYD